MSEPRSSARFLAFLFAVVALIAGAWGYGQHRRATAFEFEQRRAALLQTENDRLRTALAQQAKTAAQAGETAQRKPIEEAIAKIRGLDFKQPVVYDVLSRAGIKKTVAQKLAEQYSDEEFRNVATGLAALGLFEPNYPLKQKYIDLLGEQIAAFYDQHQHKLFMFEDASLQSAQNRVVLAHELTHALQDQNFGLLRLPLETKTNDDLALAASALVEGDATLAMSDYMAQNFTVASLGENLSGMFSQSMDQVQRAPRYLREMLVFPYIHGQQFCKALQATGGYDAVSRAFKDPPVSTSQILHPGKYFAHEEPVQIDWPDTTASGKKPIDDNVLGEMGIRILLGIWGQTTAAPAVAAGWRGDRYLVFQDAAGTELVWRSVWDTDEDARLFMETLKDAWTKRYGLKDWTVKESAVFSDLTKNGAIHWNAKDGAFFFNQKKNGVIQLCCIDGHTVILIDATNDTWANTLGKEFILNGQN